MTIEELNTLYPLGTAVNCRRREWLVNGPWQQLSDGNIVVALKGQTDCGLQAHTMAGLTEITFGDEQSQAVWNQELAEYYGAHV